MSDISTLTLNLNKSQRAALRAVEKSRENESKSVNETKLRILVALDRKVPVRVIADSLGVSLQRVYQMRDEAKALNANR